MRNHIKRALLAVFVLAFSILSGPVIVAEEPSVERGLGLLRSKGDFPRLDTSRVMAEEGLPSRVDLSGGLPTVGSQGGQASCVGWTLAYYYKTFQEYEEWDWDISSPDRQFSPAWIYNQRTTDECERDAGMSYYDGLRILEQQGAVTLASFPYDPNDSCTQPPSALYSDAWAYRVDSFKNVFAGAGAADINVLKNLLANDQPIAVGIPVYASFYEVTQSDPVVPRHRPDETLYGGHAMLIVGYDDEIGGFKTVNSWGADWGRDGYCYLSYDFMKHDAWEGWIMEDHVASGASFHGTVTVNEDAAEGAKVAALIDGVPYATNTTESRDGEAHYSVRIPVDNPNTSEKEGGAEGDVVSFQVGAARAEETATWKPGASISVDLSVSTSATGDQEERVFLPVVMYKTAP